MTKRKIWNNTCSTCHYYKPKRDGLGNCMYLLENKVKLPLAVIDRQTPMRPTDGACCQCHKNRK